MSKPRVNTNPVANQYAAPGERITEYSHKGTGGLIAFRATDDGLTVDLYRHDPDVKIRVADQSVWVAVIEWAEDYADREPAVTVARNELDARKGAATHLWNFLHDIEPDPFVRAAMDTYGNPADADPLAWWDGMRLDCDLPGFLSVESTVVI